MNAINDSSSKDREPDWEILFGPIANYKNLPELIVLWGFLYFPDDLNKRLAFQHLLRSSIAADLLRLHDNVAMEMRNRDQGYRPELGGNRPASMSASA